MTVKLHDPAAAWASLKHGGLLLAPNRLADVFPESLPPLPQWVAERLRRALVELNGDGRVSSVLMDTVLEEVLGLGRPLEPDTGMCVKRAETGTQDRFGRLGAFRVKRRSLPTVTRWTVATPSGSNVPPTSKTSFARLGTASVQGRRSANVDLRML